MINNDMLNVIRRHGFKKVSAFDFEKVSITGKYKLLFYGGYWKLNVYGNSLNVIHSVQHEKLLGILAEYRKMEGLK